MEARRTFAPRPLGVGAVLTAGGQVSLAVAGAVATLAAARILGPAGAGAFAVATAFVLGLVTLGTLGLESGIVFRVGSGEWAGRSAWLRTLRVAGVLGLAGGAAGAVLATLVPSAFRGLSFGLVVALAAALPFALAWVYGAAVALAEDRYEDAVSPSFVQAAVLLAAVPVLALLWGVQGAAAGLVLAHVLAAAVVTLRNRRALAGEPDAGEPGDVRSAAAFGLKTYGANALQLLNYRFDLFVLNAVVTGAVVGSYAVAVSVTSLVWLLPRSLSAVLLPRVAALREARADREDVEARSVRHAVLLAGVSAAAAAAGLALVPLVYGPGFGDSVRLGLLLLPGATLLGVANVLMATVVGRGRPGLSLLGSALSAPVSVGLYLAVIPAFGATGAALASSASYALSFALSAFFYRRVTGASLRSRLRPGREELADLRLLMRAARRGRRPAPSVATPAHAPGPAVSRREPVAAGGRPGSHA